MLELAHIFQDGMVLQQQQPIRIWGHSNLEETITVYLNDKCLVEAFVPKGELEIMLPPQNASFNCSLSFVGSSTLTFYNVDIGEVWIAGGQSNMEFQLLHETDGPMQITNAHNEHLRFFDVGKYSFDEEASEGLKDSSEWDQWLCFNSMHAGCFSAVGFYFANCLQEKYNVPIGIVGCNWGGTSASTWLSESYLAAKPELNIYLEEYKSSVESLDLVKYKAQNRQIREFMASEKMTAFRAKISAGQVGPVSIGKAIYYQHKLSKVIGQMGPHNVNRPAGLYNHMVRRIAGFTCKGVIWYQGEADENKPEIYDSLFASLIECWRDEWNGMLPFLFVQLAPFEKRLGVTGERFPIIREKQELVSKAVPNTYMVSIMDAGEKTDIHPKRKRPVGERLALMAMGKVYGEDILCEPPELLQGELGDGFLRLDFKYSGNGLVQQGEKLNAMCLFVNGKKVQECDCKVSGCSIEIRAGILQKDASVCAQYAQTPYCNVNLYNSAGIAAKPFLWQSTAFSHSL